MKSSDAALDIVTQADTLNAMQDVRRYSDELDADLPLVGQYVDQGREDAALDVLVAFVQYDRELLAAEDVATEFFTSEKRRSAFRIGDALVALTTRKVKADVYDHLERTTGKDRQTLYNYRSVAAAFPADCGRWDKWDVPYSTFQLLAPLEWDDRLHYLDASDSQKRLTGRPIPRARLSAMLREAKGNLTPDEHRDVGTTPPLSSRVVTPGSNDAPPPATAVGTDDLVSDLWSTLNRAVMELTDLLRPHVGEFEASRLRRHWLVEGQRVLGVVPTPPGDVDLSEPDGGWLTPDQVEAVA